VTPAVATAHGLTWTPHAVSEPVGGPVSRQIWSVQSPGGGVIQEGGDLLGPGQTRRPYDYFWAMVPMDQLTRMVHLTSSKLEARGMQPTDGGEVLKWVGVTLLATRYEFGARADLWATPARSKYTLAPAFGERTGMSRRRFDALWSCMTFSHQTGGADDASKKRRWQLINDFIVSINDHRASRVSPSDLICVDEFMCKWYRQGSHWILRGLPMYVAIDRKPENGCQIQNAAYGRSGILLRLSVVTTADHRHEEATGEEDNFPHGTAVFK